MEERHAQQRAILVLAGATAVGKTRAAIALCKHLGGEIIGADSVQVYRGFDIGSGKPAAAELAGIRHHLIDIVEPTEAIDAARFARLADDAIAACAARGAVPVVVGGTGLWLRALLRGLVVLPKADPELRASLERQFALDGAALHERLAAVDPDTSARVHPRDMIRIVRALEVHAQTGQAISQWQRAHALGQPRYHALTLLLEMPQAQWRTEIAARARAMFAAGFVDEVQRLVCEYGPGIRPLRSVGYRQIVEGLARRLPQGEIEARVVRATRLYGKRQRTWFRTDPSVDRRLCAETVLDTELLACIETHLGQGAA
jgi:tRNA dimethylallyltransferase